VGRGARKEAEEAIRTRAARLRLTLREAINALSSATETRDPYPAGHHERVTKLDVTIGRETGLSEDSIEALQIAGLVHDIGKLSIPAEILSKRSTVTDVERQLLKAHAEIGFTILNRLTFPWPIARILGEHRERIDGSGCPGGLRGEDLLIESRIPAVADTIEAMSAHRPYRPAVGIDAVFREIKEKGGVLSDPEVVDASVKLIAASRSSDDVFSGDSNHLALAQPDREVTGRLPFGEGER